MFHPPRAQEQGDSMGLQVLEVDEPDANSHGNDSSRLAQFASRLGSLLPHRDVDQSISPSLNSSALPPDMPHFGQSTSDDAVRRFLHESLERNHSEDDGTPRTRQQRRERMAALRQRVHTLGQRMQRLRV